MRLSLQMSGTKTFPQEMLKNYRSFEFFPLLMLHSEEQVIPVGPGEDK